MAFRDVDSGGVADIQLLDRDSGQFLPATHASVLHAPHALFAHGPGPLHVLAGPPLWARINPGCTQ